MTEKKDFFYITVDFPKAGVTTLWTNSQSITNALQVWSMKSSIEGKEFTPESFIAYVASKRHMTNDIVLLKDPNKMEEEEFRKATKWPHEG